MCSCCSYYRWFVLNGFRMGGDSSICFGSGLFVFAGMGRFSRQGRGWCRCNSGSGIRVARSDGCIWAASAGQQPVGTTAHQQQGQHPEEHATALFLLSDLLLHLLPNRGRGGKRQLVHLLLYLFFKTLFVHTNQFFVRHFSVVSRPSARRGPAHTATGKCLL